MSIDSSHVRFVVKWTRAECGQEFLTTNYPDLLIRDTVINGVPDRSLITRELPKDELKLSNFITNRDDFIYHEISRNLRCEFASVLHDNCKENFCKTKSEHFLDRQMPNFHTYRLGGSNYLTAAGEVAYFYKCRPRLVVAIRAQTCYDALPVEVAQNNYTLTSFKQEDGEQVIAPRFYIETLTHRITSVAKKVPCPSQFFARYKDIFGRWFAVTPQISITNPPGTLDFESLQKKANFDQDIDLSRGEVYDPDAIDYLISWLEGICRQEVVVHQLADQVGSLNPGQYITPKLMFPPHTLPGGSWHKLILGKIWGAICGFGEVFSTIFGLFIVGRIVWYLIKVVMNCGYIHGAHGCSPHLAWPFCTEVLFTHYYRKTQRQQRSDNDLSGRSRKRRTFSDHVSSVASCSCLDPCRPSDSDDDIPEGHFTHGEDPSRFHDESWQRKEEAVATSKRARTSTPHETITRAPYATPPVVTPMSSVMPTPDSEADTMSNKT